MATFDLEEQEQLAQIKAYWERYGTWIVALLSLVILGVVGYRGWNYFQQKKSTEAVALYASVVKSTQENKLTESKSTVDQLQQNYRQTAYAPRAALLLAKQQFSLKDYVGAKASLQWVVEHTNEEFLKALARYRLATVNLEENNYEEALNALGKQYPEAMTLLFEDLRGDILYAAKRHNEATTAYRAALEKADLKNPYRDQVQTKIDAIESEATGGPASTENKGKNSPNTSEMIRVEPNSKSESAAVKNQNHNANK